MSLKITSSDLEPLRVRMQGFSAGLAKREDFKKFGILIGVRAVRRNFSEQRDDKGQPWAPRKTGGRGLIFHGQSGRIARGITGASTPKGFFLAAGDATKAFNAVHNFGARIWHNSAGKKGNARRTFMYLSKQAIQEIMLELKAWAKRRLLNRA